MWNVDSVVKEYGKGPHLPDEVDVGFLTIDDHTKVSSSLYFLIDVP